MAKISLSIDELNNIVTKINTSSQKISELWNSVKTNSKNKRILDGKRLWSIHC